MDMPETPHDIPAGRARSPSRAWDWTDVVHWIHRGVLIAGALAAGGVILLTLLAGLDVPGPPSQILSRQAPPPDQVAVDIMPVKPGGPAQDYAAYVPSTVLSVPANSVVTVTIRNFDLDATPLPAGSPYTHVQGTAGGIAYADGTAYAALDRGDIAHTFTVPALHLNVPIPGRAAAGKRYVTVTFQLRTSGAGIYAWRCFAPCGDGPDGQAGPMADDTYMRGTLIVGS